MKTTHSLSNKVVVKNSSIHGRGLFAVVPIKSGEIVVHWKKLELNKSELAALTKTELSYIDSQDFRSRYRSCSRTFALGSSIVFTQSRAVFRSKCLSSTFLGWQIISFLSFVCNERCCLNWTTPCGLIGSALIPCLLL